jgi:hypothetical protein
MTQSGMRDSCHVARKQTLPIPIRSDAIENMRRLYKYQTTKDLQIMVGSLDVFLKNTSIGGFVLATLSGFNNKAEAFRHDTGYLNWSRY